MKSCMLTLAALCLGWLLTSVNAAETAVAVKVTPLPDRVRVELDGRLFTEYVFGDGATKPYCYPVLAADGTPMTRDFPMKKTGLEDMDHPWHRSLWFAHSLVNGVDFWNEANGDAGHSPDAKGKTIQDQLLETTSGAVGIIHTHDRWLAPGGKLICTDDRRLRFQGTPDSRTIDYEVTLHAQPEAPLVMGDNKDGTMALRLAQWLAMPHKSKNDGIITSTGHLVSSTGQHDDEVWGKRADWCDYFSQHNGKTYGVAIFDHPENLRHPTWWHARDYGLFGANPFGQHDFERLKDQPHAGDYTIPAGGSLTLRYRFYFHYGDEKTAKIAEHYADYAAGK